MKNTTECKNLKFTFIEKLVSQITFHGGIIIGTYGLYNFNKVYSLAYLLFSYIGIILFMRYTVCPRCPHILYGNDCVQLNPKFTRLIISNRKGPLNVFEKVLFFTVLYGILVIPIYGLLANKVILISFIITYGSCLLYLNFHLCKNCQNSVCKQNRNQSLKNRNVKNEKNYGA